MPKKPKRRPPNRRGTPAARSSRGPKAPELDEVLSDLLDDPHPLAFLAHASTLAEVLDSAPIDSDVDLGRFTAALADADSTPEAALLRVLDAFLPGRIPTHLSARRHVLPPWLTRLADARLRSAALLRDSSGDMDQVVVEVAFADGAAITMVVLVDHDAGTSIADAFALPVAIDDVLEQVGAVGDGLSIEPLSVADAAARLREAQAATTTLFEPPETDTWPQAQPLLLWMVGLGPPGGAGWPRQQWSEQELGGLAARIVARSRRIGPDAQDVVHTLLHHAAHHALGDPLRWSERSVLDVIDWIDGHVVADDQWHAQVPPALRAVIRFAHRERGMSAEQTADALAVVDELDGLDESHSALQDLYQGLEHVLPDDRLQPAALLQRLELKVGGADQLDRLAPEWAGLDPEVPEDVAPRIDEITELLRSVVADFFDDPQLADVASDLLHRAAAADPAVFRRRGDPRMTAAAATWVVAKVNDAFGTRKVVDLMHAFGLKGSPSTRATSLLAPLGLHEWLGFTRSYLGDPALMTTAYRQSIVARRDAARAALTDAATEIPATIRLAGGQTVQVERQPGMAAEMMEELRPFLAQQGVDLDDAPDLSSVQSAIDIAMEARNQALFTPDGARRAAAAAALRDFSAALAADDAARADSVLNAIVPESRDGSAPEVSAVIGLGLELLDDWLGRSPAGVPAGLAGAVLLPRDWRKRARPGLEIVALASHRRGFSTHGALITRHGGQQMLAGVAVAVAATTTAWAARTGTPIDELLTRTVR